jgi:malonate transporter and related proteins
MITIITPIFGIVLLGYFLARNGIFSRATGDGLTRFMFYVAVPAMLFQSISTTELPSEIPWKYICAFYIPSLIVFATAMLCSATLFGWSKKEQGIAGVCSAYSNMVLLGLPLLLAAYGERVTLPLFILLAPQSLLLFPATIIAVEIYGGQQPVENDTEGEEKSATRWSSRVASTLKKLLLNPIIVSLAFGIVVNINDVEVPAALGSALRLLANAAPACALTALGVSLAQYEFRQIETDSLVLALLKNLLHPLLVFLACRLFSIEEFWTQVAVFLAAMPCGINAFIFANSYGMKIRNVTQSIVISTLLSVATVALLLATFKEI